MPLAKAIVRFGLCGLIVLFACPATHALAADDVWALLRKPGHVVLLRHSNAPGSQTEPNDMNFKDCSIQRNLDADGKAQAARTGDAFRKHSIAKLQLIAGQYYRAIETAKLTRPGPILSPRARLRRRASS
jgi:hypothetical protein